MQPQACAPRYLAVGGLGAGKRKETRMRKREVEKLLYHAVAEALGIETDEPKKAEPKAAGATIAKSAHAEDHRAAA